MGEQCPDLARENALNGLICRACSSLRPRDSALSRQIWDELKMMLRMHFVIRNDSTAFQ